MFDGDPKCLLKKILIYLIAFIGVSILIYKSKGVN